MGAELIQVIRTDLLLRGKGVEDDPYRRITQYWDLEGNLLVEDDPELNAQATKGLNSPDKGLTPKR